MAPDPSGIITVLMILPLSSSPPRLDLLLPHHTYRSTLCQAEDSVLAAMFSGRWEGGFIKDHEGAYFLDYEPECWAILMGYLRQRRMAGPHTVPHPVIKAELLR